MKSSMFGKSFLKYILLIFFFSYTSGESFRCDYSYNAAVRGWLKYQEFPATWYDARLRCALEGAILASPTTRDLLALLVTSMYNERKDVPGFNVFVGIHATFSKGDYFTVDGIPLAQIMHKWEKFEPDNVNNEESCLTLNTKGLLSDLSCNLTRPYFCFKPESSTQINVCGNSDPEYQFNNQTGSCYKFHTVPRSFWRANLACTAEGGHLAIINNDVEAKIIADLFSKYPPNTMIGNFWKDVALVGFSDWGEHGDWRTIHGETLAVAGYSKFASGEPNNLANIEFCGSVYRNARLNDLDCDTMHAFICEKNPGYPPVCSAIDNED